MTRLHPLVELSFAADPSVLLNRDSLQLVLSVARKLQRLLPSDRWPQPHQMVAAAYGAATRDRFVNADEMGLGKTVSCILRLLLDPPKRFALIVATTSTLSGWEKELGLWAPSLPVTVLDSTHVVLPERPRGVLITTWDLLKPLAAKDWSFPGYGALLLPHRPSILIADEVQAAQNAESDRYQALAEVASGTPRVILLSGTPISNTAVELWQLLHILDPELWPEATRPHFESMERSAIDATDMNNLTRLQQRVRQFMVRRLKRNIDNGLLPKKYSTLNVVLSPALRKAYDQIESNYKRWLERHLRAQAALAIRSAPPGTTIDEAAVAKRIAASVKHAQLTKINYLRQFLGKAKVPDAMRWIESKLILNEQVVVFFEYQGTLDLLKEGLDYMKVPYAVIDGSTGKRLRRAAMADFQAGRVRVIFLSKAGMAGITLHAARFLLRVERWWTSSTEDQADDRVHRIGQSRQVEIVEMHVVDTYDVRMDEVVETKRQIVEAVIGAAKKQKGPEEKAQ